VVLVDIINERNKNEMMMNCIASQADPKELKKRLFTENLLDRPTELDENSFNNFVANLSANSRIKVK
jgi:hypothetical protein